MRICVAPDFITVVRIGCKYYGSDLSSGEEQIIERVIADITDTKGSKAKFHTHNNYENDQKNSHSKIYSTVTVGKISDTFCYAIEDGERALFQPRILENHLALIQVNQVQHYTDRPKKKTSDRLFVGSGRDHEKA